MRVALHITGISPLLMHNAILVDPTNEVTRAIAAIAGKTRKTDDDRDEIARLEFAGGLYINEDGPYIPTANVRRGIVEAGKSRRLGKAVQQAVVVVTFRSRLEYDGPRDIESLYKLPKHRHYVSVGIGTKRVMRMRPMFPEWSLTAELEVVTDLLNMDDFLSLVELTGIVQGLGDNRINGFGRFKTEVEEL
jgi:hypothetical protein